MGDENDFVSAGIVNDVARIHQRETSGLSSDSLQLRPFSNLELLLKEFAPRGSKFFPLRAVPFGMENHFYHIG